MSDDELHVSTRVRDPELVDALEEASDETGSRSEAIRMALREAYLGESGDEDGEDSGLPVKALEGYRKLVEWTGIGGRIELDTAESILANHLNIQKEAVRKAVIYPLREEGAIGIQQGIHNVSIIVGTLDGDDVEESVPPNVTTGTQLSVAKKRARSELDELATAEVER